MRERTRLQEIIDCIKEVVFDEEFKPDFRILIEIQAHYIPTVTEIAQIAELIIQLQTQFRNKVALVVTEQFFNRMFGLAKKLIMRKSAIKIEVFHTVEEAMEWLKENLKN
jgi:hypothetical protein